MGQLDGIIAVIAIRDNRVMTLVIGEDEGVAAIAAAQRVIAQPAIERIIAIIADEHVISRAARQDIVLRRADLHDIAEGGEIATDEGNEIADAVDRAIAKAVKL